MANIKYNKTYMYNAHDGVSKNAYSFIYNLLQLQAENHQHRVNQGQWSQTNQTLKQTQLVKPLTVNYYYVPKYHDIRSK